MAFGIGVFSYLFVLLIDNKSFKDQDYSKVETSLQGKLDSDSPVMEGIHQKILNLDTVPQTLNSIAEVHLSLDSACMHVLTVQDVLINFIGCDTCFQVHLEYPFGTNQYTPDNKLDKSHVGYCMIYSVTQIVSGNKAWGKICVEDKLPPVIIGCGINDTILCNEISLLPSNGYFINDNCGGPVKVIIADER